MKSVFERMSGNYRAEGDYFIPDLLPLNTKDRQIGKYGRMRRRFLQEHHDGIYTAMLLNGTLFEHLAEINQVCNERVERLVSAIAKQEGVTEALKAADQMEWVRCMNSIRSRAEEITLSELVCV